MIRQFNKAAPTYDAHCEVQRKSAWRLLKFLHLQHLEAQPDLHLLEVACGTGVSTEIFYQALQPTYFLATDIAANLLDKAKTKIILQNINFELADFDEPLISAKKFHLIFCNLGLQWSFNLEHTLGMLGLYLQHQGILAFSLPLRGTFPELKESYRKNFPTGESIQHMLLDLNFECANLLPIDNFVAFYPDSIEAIRSLKYAGTNGGERKESRKFSRDFGQFFLSPTMSRLTYKIGYFIVQKKGGI